MSGYVKGTLTAVDDAVEMVLGGDGSVGVRLSDGTSPAVGANVVFETSVDGVNWEPVNAFPAGTGSAAAVTHASGAGDFEVPAPEADYFRVRLTASTAGSLSVVLVFGKAGLARVVNADAARLLATVFSPSPSGFFVTALAQRHVMDSTGLYPFDPDSCAHAYTFNGPGSAKDTDTATDGVSSWKKTYTFTGSNVTGESAWIKQ